MSLIKDIMKIGSAARGKDEGPPESPRLFNEYMFIKTIQEGKKVKKQKKLREKRKNEKTK